MRVTAQGRESPITSVQTGVLMEHLGVPFSDAVKELMQTALMEEFGL